MAQFAVSCTLLLAIGAYAGTVPDPVVEYKREVDAAITDALQTAQAKVAETEKYSDKLTSVVTEAAEKFDQEVEDFRKQFGEDLDAVAASESTSAGCREFVEKIRDDISDADIGISHCFALNIEELGSSLNEVHDAAEKIIEELNGLREKSAHCVDSAKTEDERVNAIICLMHVGVDATAIKDNKIPELSLHLAKVTKDIASFPAILVNCGTTSGLTTLLTKRTEFVEQCLH